ncbi:MAG TPA: hypothetical protein VFI37_03285 [Gaiellaceae bacterium]|jgi:hypothetical protein|nr:hypothetical protein [Gaiellaceae bacterium]
MRPSACAVAAAVALAAPAGAAAPKPPAVGVAAGTIGGLRPGQPLLKFSFAWGPADRAMQAPPGGPAAFAIWEGRTQLNRAVVTFADPAETRADSIFYAGPLRTSRGDRIGTTLAQVRRHWQIQTKPARVAGLPGYVEIRVRRAWFVFDRRKRLAGVRLGSGSALAFAAFPG